jgi:hypothetical protein
VYRHGVDELLCSNTRVLFSRTLVRTRARRRPAGVTKSANRRCTCCPQQENHAPDPDSRTRHHVYFITNTGQSHQLQLYMPGYDFCVFAF